MTGDEQRAPARGRRVQVSKRKRFEVFKRDSFTCQYCGAKAPDVVLHVDHILAVAHEGDNEILNLVTACDSCNLGKSDKRLDDNTAIERQRAQLAQLQERREQVTMMVEWRRELLNLKDEAASEAVEYWRHLSGGYVLTANGEQSLRGWLRKYSIDEVLQAMEIATERNLVFGPERATPDSVEESLNAVPGVLRVIRMQVEDPAAAKLLWIRGIMRKRYPAYCPQEEALHLLQDAHAAGVSLEELEKIALRARNWSSWKGMLEELLAAAAPASSTKSAFERSLAEQARYLDEFRLDQVVGYAKGLAILDATMGSIDATDEEVAARLRANPPPPHAATLDDYSEAFGFGDAIGVARSSHREDWLVDLGTLSQDTVWALIRGEIAGLPPVRHYNFHDSEVAKRLIPNRPLERIESTPPTKADD